jgi:hypothetical protein
MFSFFTAGYSIAISKSSFFLALFAFELGHVSSPGGIGERALLFLEPL